LAAKFGEGGGAFTFLRHERMIELAGSLSWILIAGYILTVSVYGFTFGHYTAASVGGGPWVPRVAATAIIAILVAVNLRGVGEASGVEIVTVWGKLAILIALAGFGLWTFKPDRIIYDQADPGGYEGLIIGAASVFMAYEGFQLLTYDYGDIRNPKRTLQLAVLTAIPSVMLLYVVVALGAGSLVGAEELVRHKEVALSVAGQKAGGTLGKWVVSIGAVFSTASAINATVFATGRLMRDVARDGELPAFFGSENRRHIPDRAILVIGAVAILLATIGRLTPLVEAASLTFLFTFATVNALAIRERTERRPIAWFGAVAAALCCVLLAYRIGTDRPKTLAFLGGFIVLAVLVRPWLLKRSAGN
jgi:amino acid transporter